MGRVKMQCTPPPAPASSRFVDVRLGRVERPAWRHAASGRRRSGRRGRGLLCGANRPVLREEFRNFKNILGQGVIARKDTASAR